MLRGSYSFTAMEALQATLTCGLEVHGSETFLGNGLEKSVSGRTVFCIERSRGRDLVGGKRDAEECSMGEV